MDQEPTMWIKKEGTDEVQTELCFMGQDYPCSMNVKEELEEGVNKEFLEDPLRADDHSVWVKQDPELKHHAAGSEHNSVEDPLGISWPNDFIKEDPELNITENTSVKNPLGISWSTDFIKEDPEFNLEMNITENILPVQVIP
ncbi:uncharacterized protein LOC126427299 isoform X4 [Schistocerca serialis cubense]|uniref:uncharacterized protein LOC126427299 isoform X4 n=1 Tax=Schistocerca serialis cubense TaxID=2023355 RepID=UPI00214F1AB2|nr:uncharacterized protein LOC126427299 isoform X4 [Schistocerca serialis cubense]